MRTSLGWRKVLRWRVGARRPLTTPEPPRVRRHVPILLGFCLTGLSAPPAAAQELPFTHYTSEWEDVALPPTGVTVVHRDALGDLWIGSRSAGAVRYHGRTMER